MLDGLLGRGFSSKCKSLIKLVKARIDLIRKKRNAVQKFLKKDIADLLKNGLDINAYGRAAGLIVELDLSYCYDAVEQFCVHISSHLPVMQRQSECPDECKEAVSSLMFAAARFADLPELRDLRHIFTEKYGNSVEHFVNQEFVKKLASNPPTVDTKLQLMAAIAKEFSIKWDRKAFEQTLSTAPASVKDQPKRHGKSDSSNDGWKPHTGHDNAAVKREIQDISSVGRQDTADNAHKCQDGREEFSLKRDKRETSYQERKQPRDSSYKHHPSRDETVLERDKPDVSGRGRRELTNGVYKVRDGLEEAAHRDNQDILPRRRWGHADNGFKLSNGRENGVLIKDDQRKYFDDGSEQEKDRVETLHGGGNRVISSHREQEYISRNARKHTIKTDHKDIPHSSRHHNEPPNCATEKVPAEIENIKPPKYRNFIPPPYVKPNVGKHGAHHDKSPNHNRDFSNDMSESSRSGLEHVNHDRPATVRPARINGLEDQKTRYGQDEFVGDVKPKPRSVRRRHKPPLGHENTINTGVEEIEKRHRRSRRREDAKRLGLQHTLEEDHEPTDEEEKMMDRLLMHYSKKPSKYEETRVQSGLKAAAPPSQATAAEVGESQSNRSVDVARPNSGPPVRIRSLPTEPVTPTETSRLPARATSFEPDIFSQAGHVHPKLPDYDDLAARFAALRGR